MADGLNVVILAAGSGTRMKSGKHKVLHELAGKPMVQHVVDVARQLEPSRIVVVVGHQAAEVEAALGGQQLEFVTQEEQLGTAHAFLQAAPLLEASGGSSLVLNGDGALLTSSTLARLRESLPASGMSLLTARVPDPTGLGRVVKDAAGKVQRIVEHKDASPAELAIDEIVVGTYLFDNHAFRLAAELGSDNAAGEYYITDLVAAYLEAGMTVATSDTPLDEFAGVNDRSQLAAAEAVVLGRLRRHWQLAGVTMHLPETIYMEDSVVLEADVVLEPGVVLRGNTRVGRGSVIGAHSVLTDAELPAGSMVEPLSKL